MNVHRLLEAMKLAFGARSEVTDPAFATDEQKGRYHEFTTKEWANETRHKITAVSLPSQGRRIRIETRCPNYE